MKSLQVDLPIFSGPLDLLLFLIDRQELEITAVSLVQVTDQYLRQVESLAEDRVGRLIDFLVIGARLALIKSRALLPQTPVLPGIEEGEEEEDPAEALIRQLRAYKRFKTAALWLDERQQRGFRNYLRVAPPPQLEGHLDLSGVNVTTLYEVMCAVRLRAESLEESVSLILPRRLTIEMQLERLRSSLQEKRSLYFSDVLSPTADRLEVSVTLLALLELIKRQEAAAHQVQMFGPILVLPFEPATVETAETQSE